MDKEKFYVTYVIHHGDLKTYHYDEPFHADDHASAADQVQKAQMNNGVHPDNIEIVDIINEEEHNELNDLLDLNFGD